MKESFKKGIAIIEAIIMSILVVVGVGIHSESKVQAYEDSLSLAVVESNGEIGEWSGEYACNVGESVTFKIIGYDREKKKEVDIDWNKYTVKWTKWTPDSGYVDNLGEELEGSGASYTIEKVEEKDFYIQGGDNVHYNATLYNNNGEQVAYVYIFLCNKADYIRLEGNYSNRFLKEGDSVTFSVGAYDWDGNTIDLSSKGYSLTWYKIVGHDDYWNEIREEIKDITGATYTIDKIESEYLYNWATEEGEDKYYCVTLCKDGHDIVRQNFILYDSDTAIEIMSGEGEYKASVGDSVTLSPEVCDPDGNLIDLSDSKYSFKWYKVGNSWDERIQLEDTENSYTINKVQKSDFSTKDEEGDWYSGNYYIMDIYVNGKYVTNAYFYLCESDDSKPIESTTSEQPTTTSVSEQPTLSEQPTTPTSEKVTAPAKGKITKINTKKKSAKKIKLSLKKINKAKGYQVAVYTSKKTAKNDKNALVKKFVKKVSVTISSKKLKNKKRLYIKARAYVFDGKKKVYGKWSTVKQVKIKK